MDMTLVWLHKLCDDALAQAREGDTVPANRLGTNPALAHYFANVHNLRGLTPQQWAQAYPHHLSEANRLYAEQHQDEMRDARLNTIEAQLARLLERLNEMENSVKGRRA